MSTTEYPNRDALRDANDIYLDTMRAFIVHCLKQVQGEAVEYLIERALTDEQIDDFWRYFDETNDIESAIDISYFPLIIKHHWKYVFGQRFNMDLTLQSMLWLIRKGRNSCEHRGTKDLDCEFVRMNLFLIAEVLGKINRPDKQHEVEVIRDELDETARRLEEVEERLKVVESERVEYEKSKTELSERLSEAKERLEDAESKKSEYEKDNTSLSNQVKKLSKQLKTAKTGRDNYKKNLSRTKKLLDKSEAAKADYKERLETKSKEVKNTKAELDRSERHLDDVSDQLEAAQVEKEGFVARLAAMKALFTTATLDKPEIRSVFPAFDTDTPVRILDRRGTGKRNYLLELLEQKRPTVIYVQSEEKIDQLLTRVLPEKAGIIGKHSEYASDAQEMEILEKLESGELIAVVSNATLSALTSMHCVEHFIFCHLVPGLDIFFKQCEPAFTSRQNTYLHLIYDSEQDIEGLVKKYLDRETLGNFYTELKQFAGMNGDFINTDNVCNELDMEKPGIETALAIFEELRLLERNEMGVKFLPKPRQKRELDESETYCTGEELKRDVANFRAFQLEKSIEEIWEAIQEKRDIDDEQILREPNAENETAEARFIPKSSRVNAKVTEEQVREIRARREAGESYNQLAKEFGLTPTGIRNIAVRNTWKDVE